MDDGDRRSKVQRLYDACDAVFSPGKGGLPTLTQIRWLRGILGTSRRLPRVLARIHRRDH
jgi:hypothetical protein